MVQSYQYYFGGFILHITFFLLHDFWKRTAKNSGTSDPLFNVDFPIQLSCS